MTQTAAFQLRPLFRHRQTKSVICPQLPLFPAQITGSVFRKSGNYTLILDETHGSYKTGDQKIVFKGEKELNVT